MGINANERPLSSAFMRSDLDPRTVKDILLDADTRDEPNPTFNISGNRGTVFADSPDSGDPGAKVIANLGALSQVGGGAAPSGEAAPAPADAGGLGALSSVMANMRVPTVQDTLQQFAPQDLPGRQMYLALAAGFGKATKTGNFGESLGNAAESMGNAEAERQRLQMQYLPMMLNQAVTQQKMKMDMAFRQSIMGSMPALTGQAPAPSAPGTPGMAPAPQQGAQQGAQQPQGQGVAPAAAQQGTGPAPAPAQGAAPAPAPAQQGAGGSMSPVQQAEAPKVQAAWQRMGMKYPLTQAEVMAVVMSPEPQTMFGQLVQKHSEPTAEERLSINAGHMPGSPEYLADQRAMLNSKTAPSALGRTMYVDTMDGNKIKPLLGAAPAGSTYVPDANNPDNPTGWKLVPLPGGEAAISANAKASAMGAAAAVPKVAYRLVNDKYVPIQTTQAQQAAAAAGTPTPGSPQAGSTPGTVLPELPPAAEKAAEGQYGQVDKSWTTTATNNRTAQGTIRNLDNMIALADKAITGPNSDKLTFLNGLLATVMPQDSLPNDVATATDLVKKNGAQIVANTRGLAGGAGTDAYQSSLTAANPSYSMIKKAMVEASKEVKAVQQLNQAKATYLLPHYLNAGVDSAPYISNETNFDNAADARLWQLEGMPDEDRKAFVKALPPAVSRDLAAKRKTLVQMGVFKQ